jgi:hypothetical protein
MREEYIVVAIASKILLGKYLAIWLDAVFEAIQNPARGIDGTN